LAPELAGELQRDFRCDDRVRVEQAFEIAWVSRRSRAPRRSPRLRRARHV